MRAQGVCAVVPAIVAVVAVGCTSGADDETSTPSGPPARVYWPTEAWRTDDPAELDRYLQAPVAWPVDPQGYPFGGAFLRLPARDLAKIGFLYLNEGRWNGEEIIPADYIRASTTGAEGTPNAEAGYGWQWWLDDADGHPAYFARGYGGQTIHVVPDLDLVTVATSDPDTPGPDGRSFADTAVVLAAED